AEADPGREQATAEHVVERRRALARGVGAFVEREALLGFERVEVDLAALGAVAGRAHGDAVRSTLDLQVGRQGADVAAVDRDRGTDGRAAEAERDLVLAEP